MRWRLLTLHHSRSRTSTSRRSPLEALAGETGVAKVLTGRFEPADLGTAVTAAAANGPLVIIVDDAEAFARSDADEALRDWLRDTAPGQAAVVVGGNLEDVRGEMRGVVAEAKKPKAALLLSPGSSMDGDLVGIRLPKKLTGRMPPGRGIFPAQGDMTVVQVPLAGARLGATRHGGHQGRSRQARRPGRHAHPGRRSRPLPGRRHGGADPRRIRTGSPMNEGVWSPLSDTDPVPGDPWKVNELGTHLVEQAEKIRDMVTALNNVQADDIKSVFIDSLKLLCQALHAACGELSEAAGRRRLRSAIIRR
jgi:hypothetical protein